MPFKMQNSHKRKKGFVALVSVILLAMMSQSFSLISAGTAAEYADSVYRKELRIQAQLNADSCFDTVKIMAQKDYFILGTIFVPEFVCSASVTNNGAGNLNISIRTTLEGVSAWKSGSISI